MRATDPTPDLLQLLAHHLPPGTPPADLPLGAGGLGLDSIALTELLIECEEHFGVVFPPSLFDAGPLTVARLADHVRAARAQGGDA